MILSDNFQAAFFSFSHFVSVVAYHAGKAPTYLFIWHYIFSENRPSAALFYSAAHICGLHMLNVNYVSVKYYCSIFPLVPSMRAVFGLQGSIQLQKLIMVICIQVLLRCLTPSSATARVTFTLSMKWSGSWNRRSTSSNCVCSTEMSSRAPACGPSPVNSLRRGGISTKAKRCWFVSLFLELN